MSSEINFERIVQDAASLLAPTPGASVWKTFQKITAIVMMVAWLIALPVELVLHRRVNKRWMNTAFCVLAVVLLAALASFLSKPDLATVRALPPAERLIAIKAALKTMQPFEHLFVCSALAFGVHYWSNRRRFRTAQQGHSFDSGIPWLVFPPLARWWLPLDAASRLLDGIARSQRLPMRLLRGWAESLRCHLLQIGAGEFPYGPVTWLVVSLLEPVLLLLAGVLFFRHGSAPFGIYLMIVAVAMFLKASIIEASWRERVYDEMDGRLEGEAMKQLRAGRPSTQLSRAFTVPIASAVLTEPPADDDGPPPGVALPNPAFTGLLYSAFDVFPQGDRSPFPGSPTS
ncbi:MAG: hypothetical protein IT434_10135 [Phycisphaerales bacterium]|nr:hypothetical protein [Phycisphaerales bacterium]